MSWSTSLSLSSEVSSCSEPFLHRCIQFLREPEWHFAHWRIWCSYAFLFLLAGVLVTVDPNSNISSATDSILVVSSPWGKSSSLHADIKGSSATLEMYDDENLGSSATEDSSTVTFDSLFVSKEQRILKGHSQLVHMRIRYHFIANLHITLHLKKRVWRRKWEAHVSKPCRIEVLPSQTSA